MPTKEDKGGNYRIGGLQPPGDGTQNDEGDSRAALLCRNC